MAQQKIIWSYNGIRVTRRWLEFNYGRQWVSDVSMQAEAYFRSSQQLALDFGNGVVAISAKGVK